MLTRCSLLLCQHTYNGAQGAVALVWSYCTSAPVTEINHVNMRPRECIRFVLSPYIYIIKSITSVFSSLPHANTGDLSWRVRRTTVQAQRRKDSSPPFVGPDTRTLTVQHFVVSVSQLVGLKGSSDTNRQAFSQQDWPPACCHDQVRVKIVGCCKVAAQILCQTLNTQLRCKTAR